MDNLEIQLNKYISRSLVNCLSAKLNMDIHEDTGFLTNHFEPSSERGTFRIGQNMVTFPLHTVTFPWYSVLFMGSAYQQQQVFFKISTHWEHYFGCSKFRRCRFLDLYVLYVRILFDANLLSILGLNLIILLSIYQFSISPTTANSDEPIAFEEHNRWCFENPGKRR